MQISRSNGFTRIDVCACIACGLVLVSMAAGLAAQEAPANQAQPRRHILSVKDTTQVQQIHKAMIIFARENKERFPTPGLINRLPVELPGQPQGNFPGMGPEDISINTTANLYSAMVAQNYFNTDLVVSPVERNPHVSIDFEYEYDAYNPAKDTYWDSTFRADLAEGSNASYAHLPIFGPRAQKNWTANMDHHIAQLGNRGPRDGAIDPKSYTCGPHGHWLGNIVFADNHVEFLSDTSSVNAQKLRDNLFLIEADADNILAFTKSVAENGPDLQFD